MILIYFEEILALNTYLHLIIGVRVTLVVAFDILPQNFGRWWGPTNGYLLFYECRLGGGDTMSWQRHPAYLTQNNLFEVFALTGSWNAKNESLGETFTNFFLFDIVYSFLTDSS